MLYLRQVLTVAVIAAPCWIGAATTQAKTGEENSAVSLLLQAQQQYDHQNFQAARKALWNAYGRKDQLSPSEQTLLQQRLGEVDQALQQETIGKAIYSTAKRAMNDKNWRLAKDGFAKTARCPFLPAEIRSDAQEKLALAEMKLATQMAASVKTTPKETPAKAKSETSEAKPSRNVVVLAKAPQSEIQTPRQETADGAKQTKQTAPVPPKPAEKESSVVAKKDDKPAPKQVSVKDPAKKTKTSPVIIIAAKPEPAKRTPGKKTPAPAEPAEIKTPPAESNNGIRRDQARRIKVDMLTAQGKDAMNKNQPDKAIRYFQRALEMDPENPAVRRQLEYARRQTAQPAESTILTKYVRQKRIAKQIAETDIAGALRRSMELMAKPSRREDFEAAAQAAQVSKSILQNNKSLFTTTQYREQLGKVENQIRWVDDKREAWEKAQVLKTVNRINIAEQKREAEARMRKEKKISELVLRARALRQDQQFTEALRILEQVVEIDPKNTWALDNIYWLRQFITLKSQKRLADADKIERAKMSGDLRATEIPWYDKIRYPKDWKELTARRERYSASSSTESDENLAVLKKLNRKEPRIDLTDVRFIDAIDFLRDISNANIHVSWGALEVDNPEIKDKQISVNLTEVSIKRALDVMLDSAGGGIMKLGYVVDEGVITIDTQDNINALTYPQVYDIRDLLARVPNFIGPRVSLENVGDTDMGTGSSLSGSGSSSSSSGGEGLFEDTDTDEDEDAEDVVPTRSEMVNMLRNLIVTTVDRESWYPNGNGQINELNGNLVITQTAQNHREVQKLIARLREMRTIQISVEARFITVNTGFLSQIGVDLDFYFNIGSNIGGPSTVNPLTGAAMAPNSRVTDPWTNNAIPIRNTSTWNQAGNNADASLRKVSPIGATQQSMNFANVFGAQTNVPNGIGTVVAQPAMSIVGTFLDDLQVDFLIQATQAHSSTRTLTAPRVTLFNGQRAYVSVSTSQAFIAGVEPYVSENTSALRPIINYIPTGAALDVDATVSHDRRYVTMTLRPWVSTLNGSIREVPVFSGGGGLLIGLPNVTTQLIETTVSVPDGGTLLIGGQKLSGEVEREMGVPVISKLPIINRAFTNKGKLRDEQTLLILVKPTIIIQAEAEQDRNLRNEQPAYQPGLSYSY
ncbi:MAG: hypothetical protein JXA11_01740 [Phycisphaerae bacterium]|nr:hypothetical protein [Phycisphaerae bacterium]